MKHAIVLLVAVAMVSLGLWLALHATNTTDAAVWGYIAGMYGACSVRIAGETA